jgi:hypothetical protein
MPAQGPRLRPSSHRLQPCCGAQALRQCRFLQSMIHHEVQAVRAQIMSNPSKQALGCQKLQRQTPRQYGSGVLVTVAQRGYSFGLLEVYGTKFAGGRFFERTARPSYALRDAVPKAISQGFYTLKQ